MGLHSASYQTTTISVNALLSDKRSTPESSLRIERGPCVPWETFRCRRDFRTELVTGAFITATVYKVDGEEFALEADIGELLDQHGPGVYTAQVWATLEGEPAVISAVSVFHEVEIARQ